MKEFPTEISYQLDYHQMYPAKFTPKRDPSFSSRSSPSMLRLPIPIPSDMVSLDCGDHAKVRSLNGVMHDTILLTIPSVTDWFFFLVLDIGNATFEAIPLGVRFAIGILQATAVRAAGFVTISLSTLAPAVQWVSYSSRLSADVWPQGLRVLYVMMMYVSVCEYRLLTVTFFIWLYLVKTRLLWGENPATSICL